MRWPKTYEWRPLIKIILMVAYFPILIKCMTLPRLMAWLDLHSHSQHLSGLSVMELMRLNGAIVRRAPHYGIGDCFLRSLVLYRLLKLETLQPSLVIGVNLIEGELGSHCWVELEQKPLGVIVASG